MGTPPFHRDRNGEMTVTTNVTGLKEKQKKSTGDNQETSRFVAQEVKRSRFHSDSLSRESSAQQVTNSHEG